jgi:holin-like protein
MIRALAILLTFQLIGEIIVKLLAIPFPGPVLGMLLLFLTLEIRGTLSRELKETSQTLLSHLSLLFVPAAVGVIVHAPLIQAEWLPILASLTIGTIVTMAVTALTTCVLLRRKQAMPLAMPPDTTTGEGEDNRS